MLETAIHGRIWSKLSKAYVKEKDYAISRR